mmetsp:Transcript_20659/g.44348  ORF Transcript_20659/g.44348 Transcript_20659/m.44348 type:complete len:250 (-) Transcript_20659:169-918(-)
MMHGNFHSSKHGVHRSETTLTPRIEATVDQLWTNCFVVHKNIYQCTSHTLKAYHTFLISIHAHFNSFFNAIKAENCTLGRLPSLAIHSFHNKLLQIFDIGRRAAIPRFDPLRDGARDGLCISLEDHFQDERRRGRRGPEGARRVPQCRPRLLLSFPARKWRQRFQRREGRVHRHRINAYDGLFPNSDADKKEIIPQLGFEADAGSLIFQRLHVALGCFKTLFWFGRCLIRFSGPLSFFVFQLQLCLFLE